MNREMFKTVIVVSIILFVSVSHVQSQGRIDNLANQEFAKVIPSSPTASAIGKYGDWPISYFTGTPKIEIPIYEIQVGKLRLPIRLSYHASGIKVEEAPSWVGAGWSLDAGGAISRTVFGAPDEVTFLNPSIKGRNIPSNIDLPNDDVLYNKFTKIIGDLGIAGYDAEPDIYFFNFAGISGKFFMDEDGNFRSIPANNLKIKTHPINLQPIEQRYWEIIDESGTSYILGAGQATESVTTTIYPPPLGAPTPYTGAGVSAWYLTKMISADRADTINFEYITKTEAYTKKASQVYRIPLQNLGNQTINTYGYGYNSNVTSGIKVGDDNITFSGKSQISRIYWRGGEIKFLAGAQRLDITGIVLGGVEVYNAGAQRVKKIQLSYINDVNRLFLDKVTEVGNDNTTNPPYSFTYVSGLPNRYSDAQDFWGYYNGANSNTHMLPYEPELNSFSLSSSFTIPNANRKTNASAITAGTLKRIYYPTGGFTEFEMEANTYYTSGNAQYISTITEPGTYVTSSVRAEALDQTQFPNPTYPRVQEISTDKTQYINMAVDFNNYRKGAGEKDSWLPSMKVELLGTDGSVQVLRSYDAFNDWDLFTKTYDPVLGVTQMHMDINNLMLSPGRYRFTANLTCGKVGGNCGNITPATSAKLVFSYDKFVPPSPTVEYSRLCGGLRVKRISNFTQDGVKASERSFDYTDVTTVNGQQVIISSGTLLSKPKFASLSYQPFANGTNNGCTDCFHVLVCNINTHSLIPNGLSQGPHIGYSKVKEFISGGDGGYNYYEYSMFNDEFNTPTFNVALFGSYGFPVNVPTNSNEYKRGLLLKSISYKKSGTQYIAVKEVRNSYSYNDSLGAPNFYSMNVLKVSRLADSLGTAMCYTSTNQNCGPIYIETDKRQFRPSQFSYGIYKIRSAWIQKTKEITFDYDQNGTNPVVVTTDLSYSNPSHMQVTKTEITDSRNGKIRTVFSYPLDYTGITATDNLSVGIKNLQNKNLLNATIEKSVYRLNSDGSQLRLVSSLFNEYMPNEPLLSKIYMTELSRPSNSFVPSLVQGGGVIKDQLYKAILLYNAYDATYKNLLEEQKLGDKKVSYIWGYNGLFPIAKVENASSTDIAFTSFESSDYGNWDPFSGTITYSSTSPTGNYYFNLNSGSPSAKLSKLANIGSKYIVSYWRNATTPYVINGATGATVTSGPTINGWTYHQHLLTASSSSISITGTGGIDEVRLYPMNAVMSTFSYSPLVGLITQVEGNCIPTYFEYDGFNRLILIRDQFRNIVKKICYSYNGQVSACQ